MTTCMRLYLAHQSDFYAFTKAPRTLGIWLHSPHPSREVSLQDAWQDLDALLSSSAAPSPLRAAAADWTYPTAADLGGHAISAASAERLLHSIQQVDRQQVASYVEHRSTELSPEELNSGTERLLAYLTRLREACELAVSKGYGIFMALWEEPAPKAG
jgi:hypothetical protein